IVAPFEDSARSSKQAYIGRGSHGVVYRVESLVSSPAVSGGEKKKMCRPATRKTYLALKVIHTTLPSHELSAKMIVEATVAWSLAHPQLMPSSVILLGDSENKTKSGSIGLVMPLGIVMDEWFRVDSASNEPAC